MTSQVRFEEPDTILISGMIDFETVGAVYDAAIVCLNGTTEIHVDFQNMTAKDSAVLSLMVALVRQAEILNVRLSMGNINKHVLDLVRVSGLEAVLPI